MITLHKLQPKIVLYLAIISLIGYFILCPISLAVEDEYPKIANIYQAWHLKEEDMATLAKWNVVVLSQQILDYSPDIQNKLKAINPQIKILIYVPSEEITHRDELLQASFFWRVINEKAEASNWWLKSPDGQKISIWSGNWMINITDAAPAINGQTWADYLPNLVNDAIIKKYPNIDGIFYDNVWAGISFINQPIDLNNDGILDNPADVDAKWQTAMKKIINTTRQLAPDKIIIGNANTNMYNSDLNGRLHESFPYTYEGSWENSMKKYLNNDLGFQPEYFLINVNTNNTGAKDDYRLFRYGFASTLLGDGYYSFDYGDQGHDNLWWYDEYDVYLGNAVSTTKNILDPSQVEISPSVWKREFENGVVLINTTNEVQKIKFTEEYEKIKGSQDQDINNGSIIKSLKLNPQDGIVLLRRLEEFSGTPYFNGTFVRSFNGSGEPTRNGFFIYDKDYSGGSMIAKKDINNDGIIELIVADKSVVTIYDNNGNMLDAFYPYGPKYNKGLNFALSDFENDGYWEIVTGTMRGYEPLVKVFNYKGEAQGEGFYAYAKTYKGGVNVAVCDTKGNGKKQIITGTGYMGGPQVRAFDKDGKLLSGGFFAYDAKFRGGVNVACGDVDGNGRDEIITGAGYGGSSHVRYFDGSFKALSPGFWAFDKESRTGVKVMALDIDHDGKAEILTASPETFTTASKIK